ncbi:precorrin-2/cobalt-factor-2 C20-methyltransferase [Halanaerobium saccharolyticum]|uniref:Precorrin-2/cobalt-factor-2 C20-methyltransferase n=1 Tax=Halanaerobium saccharolyticum TaxID=43595 RepID=A0A4R7Z6W2_9FIRM|nr:precorrin-2 C(20)-methyltransferase [Halanaerobium saccharolyticum]RAK10590.1 precorrin-2/cobalt-factor-2 C20-methyltransferase [Halanaerobium saccharolyticum]TDW06653.1 precorrin-2/cobalt-factor-2 C20-methyltransferase [Halanaerobium saccharolyticum]TDX62288.1 precorrin-2/cobalt-factor-2 C20-methyltransferase [Halanaerobium saccharolyticum]
MAKKLYGIGVGVGEPGLVTLKAVEILKEVDYVCTPLSTKSDSSKALEIISNLIDLKDRVIKLRFKMSKNKQELEQSRSAAAQKIYQLLEAGKTVAFVTIGDPFLYSTYAYMLKKIKEWDNSINIETVPGINSIAAATSSYNLPLAEGKENTAILSELKNEEHIEKVFNLFETVVILKLSRNFEIAYSVLEKLGLKENVLIASKCGFEDEFYTENIEVFKNKKIEYLTLMIVKRKGI